jgi:hypothetical protein
VNDDYRVSEWTWWEFPGLALAWVAGAVCGSVMRVVDWFMED